MTGKQICEALELKYDIRMSQKKLQAVAIAYASLRKQVQKEEELFGYADEMQIDDMYEDTPDFEVEICQNPDDPFDVTITALSAGFGENPIDEVPTLKALKYTAGFSVELNHADCVSLRLTFDLH